MELRVEYFGALQDQAGCQQETLSVDVSDCGQLLNRLKSGGKVSMDQSALRVAVNDEFCSWDKLLQNGDRVALMPPMAGG